MDELWQWLVSIIPKGQQEAVSMTYLAEILGLSKRALRKEIENARKAGVLICSSDRGYYMPESILELRDYAHRTRARIRTGSECLAPFLREIKRAEGIRA